MFKTILVPTDFTAPAREATTVAGELARATGGRLVLLKVLDVPLMAGVYDPLLAQPTGVPSEVMAEYGEAASTELESAVAALTEKGLTVEGRVSEGDPSEVIVDVAAELNADVIVMGTHGRFAVRRLLLGSTANDVVRTASMPVLSVPPRALEDRKADQFKKLLVSTDFSSTAEAALTTAVQLARQTDAELRIVHVYEPPELAYGGYPYFPVVTAVADAEREKVEADLTARLDDLKSEVSEQGVTVSTGLLSGHPGAQILDEARDWGADLLVLGTHGRRGFRRFLLGSVAERLVREAPCPVLTISPETA
jgi:nucleotide-binding universal stress UspA family protein